MTTRPYPRKLVTSKPLEDCLGKALPQIHHFISQSRKIPPSYSNSASNSPFLHPFAAFLSPSEDQTTGKDEKNLGGESSRTPKHGKKPTDSKPVSCLFQKISKNVRNGSSKEQNQQQRDNKQRERGIEAASCGQKSLLSGRKRTFTDISDEAQTERAPRHTPEDVRSKLSAFRFKANTARIPVCGQDSDVHQDKQDSPSRRTLAAVGGSASEQVGTITRVSSGGRKRKHLSND